LLDALNVKKSGEHCIANPSTKEIQLELFGQKIAHVHGKSLLILTVRFTVARMLVLRTPRMQCGGAPS
jgi:hypothetical protein